MAVSVPSLRFPRVERSGETSRKGTEASTFEADPSLRSGGTVESWVAERFMLYGRACLVVALFAAPLVVDSRNISLLKLTVWWVFSVAGLAFLFSSSLARRAWFPVPRVGWAALSFAAAVGLATAWSISPMQSVVGTSQRYIGLLPILMGVAVMFTVIGLYWCHPGHLSQLAWASAIAAVLMSGYVLLQAAGLDWTEWNIGGGPSEFPTGTMGNSNFAGGYLAIALPLVLYAAFVVARSRRHIIVRAGAGALFGLTVSALWFTRHRGGILAAFVALVVMALLYRRRPPRWVAACAWSSLVVVALAFAVTVWHPGMEKPPGRLAKISTSTLVNRSYYWKTGWRIFLDHPVVGTGPDTYYAYYPQYRDRADAIKNPGEIADQPHNIFVDHLSNTGFVGLGTYLATVGLALWSGVRCLRRVDDSQRPLLLAFVGSLVAYLVQGFFSIDLPVLAVLGWVAVGAIACLADPGALARRGSMSSPDTFPILTEPRPTGDSTQPPATKLIARSRLALQLTVLVVAAGLVVVGIRPFRAEVMARRGDLVGAAALAPAAPEHPYAAGILARRVAANTNDPRERQARLNEADIYFRKALKLHPNYLNYLLQLASFNTYWALNVDASRFEIAEHWWQRLIAADPKGQLFEAQYAKAREAMRQKAEDLTREAVRHSDGTDGWLQAAQVYLVLGEVGPAREALGRAMAIDPGDAKAQELFRRTSQP